jgi:hypothetical protein
VFDPIFPHLFASPHSDVAPLAVAAMFDLHAATDASRLGRLCGSLPRAPSACALLGLWRLAAADGDAKCQCSDVFFHKEAVGIQPPAMYKTWITLRT